MMIADLETVLLPVIRQLSAKPRWPYEVEGQMELARIAREYGNDLTHVRETIRDMSENWDHCPDGKELREALTGKTAATLPAFTGRTTCPLSLCDGSGWVAVYQLRTRELKAPGVSFKRKEAITFEQYRALSGKLDPETQELYEGAKRCACRPAVMTQEGK